MTKTNSSFRIARCSLLYLMFLAFNLATEGHDRGEDWDNECSRVQRCRKGHGPAVRFPFRLRDHHHPNCGYPDPAFELSCDQNNNTLLNLPRSAKLFVKKIDFIRQVVEIYNPYDNGCLLPIFVSNPHLNISASPYKKLCLYEPYDLDKCSNDEALYNYVIFNCSTDVVYKVNYDIFDFHCIPDDYVSCLSIPGYFVRAISPVSYSTYWGLTGCSSIGVTLAIPYDWIQAGAADLFYLQWDVVPDCVNCEQQGMGCRFNITTATKTECFHLKSKGAERKRLMIGAILGSFVLIVVAIVFYRIYRSYELKKKNEVKIKQFLEDYKSLKATRYSYADIKIITNQFNQELGKGAFGTVYKGKLANNILVAVKILTSDSTRNGKEFINEVASMGRIHHVNVARLVGFCADGGHRALVYEFLSNESLEKFIFSKDEYGNRVALGLEKLQDIALGIAKGMEYLHHGCDQQILHFDIKPHNILLDHNFVPKISDFGLAKLCSKEKSVVTMTAARGTMGYIAPEVASKNFGKPSYKSDVYSYGMLLLEMVGGRKNLDVGVENSSQVYFPEWVYKRVDQGEDLRIKIEEEGQAKIAKKLTIVALQCIQWHPMNRPSMKLVVQMLEGEADNLTVPPNPFASAEQGTKKTSNRPTRPQNLPLEIITEAE